MSVALSDYTLYFDGSIVTDPSKLHRYMGKVEPSALFVSEMTHDLIKYNRLVPPDKRIRLRDDFTPTLPIPHWADDYMFKCTDQELQLYVCKRLQAHCASKSVEYGRQAVERFGQEWELFSRKGMFLLLRVLIGIINTLTKNSVPWGPGRGSSTSSYILFLIGLHNVDSVLYDVDVTDFIR